MNPHAKAKMAIVLPFEIKCVGLGIATFIPIGTGQGDIDGLATADNFVTKRYIFRRKTHGRGLHRPIIANQLFHGTFDELGICPQLLQLIGML